MRTLLIVILTALLASCGKPAPDAETNAAFVNAFRQTCSFQPTPGTIAAIVAAWDVSAGAATGVVEAIVQQVCTALTKEQGENFALAKSITIKSPSGKEVKVEGEFVGKPAAPPAPPKPEAPSSSSADGNGTPPPMMDRPAEAPSGTYHEVQPGPPEQPKFGEKPKPQ